MARSAAPASTLELDNGKAYRYRAEADAGIRLGDGSRWWGTRLTYWAQGENRQEHVTIMDTHPFDTPALEAALSQWLTTGKAALT